MTIESELDQIQRQIFFLRQRIAQIQITSTGGAPGTTDHSALSNLSYAAAGHTGFSPDTHNHDAAYLGISAKAADSDKLDNHDTSYFATALGADDNYVTDAEKAALHAAGSDTTLGSGCVAADHGTAATDMVVNVCYGTGAAPTASTTTEGTIYMTYTA
jgi:hypothetical protein